MTSILDGVRIFLQVKRGEKYKLKEVKDNVKYLGATLALSEKAADIVVWYKPNDPLPVRDDPSSKVHYVPPDYLQSCRAAGKRLQPQDFALSPSEKAKTGSRQAPPSPGTNRKKSSTSTTTRSPSPKKSTRRPGVTNVPSDPESLCSTPYLMEDPSPARDLRPHPFASDSTIEKEVEDMRFAMVLASAKKRSAQARSPEKHSSSKTTESAKKKKDPFLEDISTQKSVSNNELCSNSGGLAHSSSVSLTQKLPRKEPVEDDDDLLLIRKKPKERAEKRKRESSPSKKTKAVREKKSKTEKRVSPVKDKKAPRRRTNHKSTKTDDEEQEEEEDPSTFLRFSPIERLTPLSEHKTEGGVCYGASSCRIACQFSATCSAFKRQFLYDVIHQLGAECIEDYYYQIEEERNTTTSLRGKRKKTSSEEPKNETMKLYSRGCPRPTHLVLETDADLSPLLLLCKALGVSVVTPQWLYDAVQLGALPCVVPDLHHHPVYGREDDTPSGEEDVFLSASPSGELGYHQRIVAEELYPFGERWCRPYYRPLLQGCSTHLWIPDGEDWAPRRHPTTVRKGKCNLLEGPMDALLQATELVRTLGGTIARTLQAHTPVDLIVDLKGFYADRRAGEEEHQTPPHHHHPVESLDLNTVFQSAVQCMESLSTLPSSPAAPSPKDQGTPVVRVEWLVYSILRRQRAPIAPFLLRYHVPLSIPHNKSDSPLKTKASTNASRGEKEEEEEGLGVMERVGMKQSEGPRSAVKQAWNQLDTQQITQLGDSDGER